MNRQRSGKLLRSNSHGSDHSASKRSNGSNNRAGPQQLGQEKAKELILKIQEHLTQREHPIRVILDFFQDQFAKVYAELVDSGSGDSK